MAANSLFSTLCCHYTLKRITSKKVKIFFSHKNQRCKQNEIGPPFPRIFYSIINMSFFCFHLCRGEGSRFKCRVSWLKWLLRCGQNKVGIQIYPGSIPILDDQPVFQDQKAPNFVKSTWTRSAHRNVLSLEPNSWISAFNWESQQVSNKLLTNFYLKGYNFDVTRLNSNDWN